MIVKWSDEHAPAGSYVDWYAYQHPQLGKVELGGWNTLYTWRNPPHAMMSQEAGRHLPFALSLASLLPHLGLHTLQVTRSGETRWTIDLIVENHGYLPAYTSQQARKRKAARPVI